MLLAGFTLRIWSTTSGSTIWSQSGFAWFSWFFQLERNSFKHLVNVLWSTGPSTFCVTIFFNHLVNVLGSTGPSPFCKTPWCGLGVCFSSRSVRLVGTEQAKGCSVNSPSDPGGNCLHLRKTKSYSAGDDAWTRSKALQYDFLLVLQGHWGKLALSYLVWEIDNVFMHYLPDKKLRHSHVPGPDWLVGIELLFYKTVPNWL